MPLFFFLILAAAVSPSVRLEAERTRTQHNRRFPRRPCSQQSV